MKQLIRLTVLFCACAALALTVVAGPEPLPSGKEMKQVAPAPPTCDFNWTGFYVGANGGYGWGSADTDFDPLPNPARFFSLKPTTLHPDPDGIIGGGQIGFNWQWNKWLVLGIETDFQGTDIEGDETESPIIQNNGTPVTFNPDSSLFAHERIQWFGSTRARIGISPWCRWFFYATGGVAYGDVDYSANTNFGSVLERDATFPVHFSSTKVGWIVGGGIEWMLTHHWSIRAEYLYYDLGDEERTADQLVNGVSQGPPFFVHYNFDTSGNIVRGGLNFKF